MADRAPDTHDIKCKVCGIYKTRIRDGKYGKKGGRTPRWVGVDGKLWNGCVCGECHAKRAAVNMFNKRAIGD